MEPHGKMESQAIPVLLIGDENEKKFVADLFARLTDTAFVLDGVEGYEEAVIALDSRDYEAILLSVQEGDGNELKVLDALSEKYSLPILLVLDGDGQGSSSTGTRAQVADRLRKSVLTPALLERAIFYAVERRRVEAAWRSALTENNRLAAAIANLSTAVIITDPHQRDNPIIFVNPAFSQITGYSVMEATGQNSRFLQGDETDPNVRREIRESLAAGRAFRGTILNYRKDGTPFWNDLAISPVLEQGRLINWIGLMQDATSRVQAEEVLQQSHDELERHVEARTQELRANSERLHRINREMLGLTRLKTPAEDLTHTLRQITEAATRTLGIERASVWLFFENGAGLRCVNLYLQSISSHGSSSVLLEKDYPNYFRALVQERTLAVANACHDSRTEELCESYLKPSGVTSMLIAPILKSGVSMGAICCEHVGAPREWMLEEQTFAGSLADLVALSLEAVERRQAEMLLRLAKEEAEEARRQAEASQEEAVQANRAKSEFLSRMSHELRTPLNSILGFGQLLQRDDLTDKQLERMDLIVSAGRHLLDLINEVLDIARVEAGRMALSIEPVRLSDVVSETLSLISPLAARRGITLENEVENDLLFVSADRQKLKQVLLNLLSNAVKYNCTNGRVRVWCESPSRQDVNENGTNEDGENENSVDVDEFLRFAVSNTGHGLAAEQIKRLFVPFERLGAESSGAEGTGLGLALSKRLIEAMGGTIQAQSTPNVETIFTCELPVAQDSHEVLDVAHSEYSALTNEGLGVLYIEDNLANLQLVESILSDSGKVRLMTAMQGGLGLELAREHRPDVILLDLHLPDIGGDEVLRRLQADEHLREIPVVVLSADATPGQSERLLRNGARYYLTKPLNVEQFLRVVDDVMQVKANSPDDRNNEDAGETNGANGVSLSRQSSQWTDSRDGGVADPAEPILIAGEKAS